MNLGSRPEKLPAFDEDCWNIMERCWAGDPHQRPLLGEVEPKLVEILKRYKSAKACLAERQGKSFLLYHTKGLK